LIELASARGAHARRTNAAAAADPMIFFSTENLPK